MLTRLYCYHLIQLMPFLDTSSGDCAKEWERVSTGLPSFFKAYAEKRQPRTSALVKEARAVGERRVLAGGTALCRERDAVIAKAWSNPDIVMAKYNSLLKEPF